MSLEDRLTIFMTDYGIEFTRPEAVAGAGRLDFYVRELDLFIEVKAWSSERIHPQIVNTPRADGRTIVLVGEPAVEAFLSMWRKSKGVDKLLKTFHQERG